MRHRIGTEAPAQEGIENFKGIFQQNLTRTPATHRRLVEDFHRPAQACDRGRRTGSPAEPCGCGTRKVVLTAIIPLPQALAGLAHRQMGLKTLSDHFQELGADFGEEIERRASDAKLILETAAKHGVPVEMLWKPAGNPSIQLPIIPSR